MEYDMNLKSKIALAALALTAGSSVMAQVAYNVGVVSEYRYRGLSQTNGDPAVQGGADYAHSSGFYLGAWGSNISWIKDSGAKDSSFELDIYGGYKGTVGPVAYDVGYLRYEYVGNKLGDVAGFKNANTDEAYVAGSYGPFTLKYSYAFSNLFGAPDSKGTTYTDLSATFDLGKGFSLVPHVGFQDFKSNNGTNNDRLDYTDYTLTLAKDFGAGYTGSLTYVNVDQKTDGAYARNLAKDQVILGVKYSF
jgi:uncharacterized protein (TIGR02001 family)